MSYKFFPHTEDDIRAMLKTCGEKSLDDLYKDIPKDLVLKKEYDLPEGLSEIEVRKFFNGLADGNETLKCLIGAGCYDHYSPSVVNSIVSRSEFLTSYTPYQAEISQGTLQYIFEYQSMMAMLTGMEVSNASMYDGCTATAEAMMMAVAAAKKRNKTLLIMNNVASTLGVLKTPGEWGADIAVGDGQSLGIPMNFGGPYVGYLCTSKKLIRKMPGRIVGATTDMEGKRTFVLTLQAREQHIRREKATSNICSNESLMALYVTVYMALMGKEGLREVNELGYSGAHYLAEKLCELKGFSMAFPDKPFLNEFAVKYDGDIDELQNVLLDYNGVQLGLKIADHTLLLCVTETISKDELDEVILTCKAYTEGEDEDE